MINKKENFIKKASIKHNHKYDYSKVEYKDSLTKIIIICPIHGEFIQTPQNHLRGRGCSLCANMKKSQDMQMSNEIFIQKANEIHNFQYDYSQTTYNGMNEMITYICPIHGKIEQQTFDHLRGFGCYRCGNLESKNENELFDFIKKTNLNVEQGNRTILKGKELDIYIPSKQIAIEYNGLRWHSEEFGRNKWYHFNKTLECNNKGIKLLQIFEDEFIEHKEIVLNKISHILGIQQNLPRIMGRKCRIEIISKDIAEQFLNDYHIQGYARSTVYLGALYEDKLIAVMTFKKETKNSSKWELTRFASDYHYVCQGVGGKLFNWFIKQYKPSEVKSFADRRWTLDINNNLYTKLGFELASTLNPDYKYILKSNPKKRIHKFNFRKQILHKKYNLPLEMTESEMVKELGYDRIWDCGLFKFKWKRAII